jgi:long-chain acyl-CoA synthetase
MEEAARPRKTGDKDKSGRAPNGANGSKGRAEPAAAPSTGAAPATAAAGGTMVQMFVDRVKASGPRTALRYKKDGAWREVTWNEWNQASREIAAALMQAGISPGDRVCVLAQTRTEWVLSDVAIGMCRAGTVPIYQSNTPKECAYIIKDSGAKAIFAEDPTQLEKLFADDAREDALGGNPVIVTFDEKVRFEKPDRKGRLELGVGDAVPAADRERVVSLEAFRRRGAEWLKTRAAELDARIAACEPDDLFTIVYTSGTTGTPKGVVLLHRTMAAECESVRDVLPIHPEDEQLLFLPLAHIFAKVLEWSTVLKGSRIAFGESLGKLKENLAEVRPTFMGAVPRVYEKFYAGIQQTVNEQPRVKKALMKWAFATGAQAAREIQKGHPVGGLLGIKRDFAERLVFSKLKKKLGLERMRFMVSGAAPLAREIGEFFHGVGILVLEGYGLTETAAATHINRLDRYRFGTVGPVVPGVECRIAPEDGEILVRGGNIMVGYYNRPDETKEVLDPDGWFHTGDIGEIDEGFLRITDRKKDLIVTAGGKKVAPQALEGQLKTLSPLVSQVLVHGDMRKFISALVTISEDNVAKWATQNSVSGDYAALVKSEEVRRAVQSAVDEMNKTLASYSQVKKIAILPKDLSQEAGELTPTLKVKRKFCTEKYKAILDGFYA